nr:hypothetical protein RVX_3066 [Nitratidesulfovibrio sp. HK-II]
MASFRAGRGGGPMVAVMSGPLSGGQPGWGGVHGGKPST